MCNACVLCRVTVQLRTELSGAKTRLQESKEECRRDISVLRNTIAALETEKSNAERLYRMSSSEVERLSNQIKEASVRQAAAVASALSSVATQQPRCEYTPVQSVKLCFLPMIVCACAQWPAGCVLLPLACMLGRGARGACVPHVWLRQCFCACLYLYETISRKYIMLGVCDVVI